MQIDSVRALKQEVNSAIIVPMVDDARAARSLGVPAMSIRRVIGPERTIGLGIARGSAQNDYRLAVRLQRHSLDPANELPNKIRSLAREEVDFRVVGRILKRETVPWHRMRQRPLLLGASVGHYGITAGSIGAFPTHRKTGKVVLLSNNHVLAKENRASIGDPILQAGFTDGGTKAEDSIGGLLDFVPLKTAGANLADCAIAAVNDGLIDDGTITTLTGRGRLKGLRKKPIEPGEPVFKLGRTTGLTEGQVSAIEVDDLVFEFEIGNMEFDRQIEIEGIGDTSFSAGGDSGSLIVDADGYAVGLLCAGSERGGTNGKGLTYANELATVLQQLDLALSV